MGGMGTGQEILDNPNLEAVQRINRKHTAVYVEAHGCVEDATEELDNELDALVDDCGNLPLDSFIDVLERVSA